MERPRFSQRDAAAVCGVSQSTIRRRREGGSFPGAVKDPSKGWLIPVEDLLAAGFTVNAPAPPEQPSEPPSERLVSGVSGVSGGDLAQLREEVERERHRRELAEAQARSLQAVVERQDAHLEDMRRAMRALTAGPASTPVSDPEQPTPLAQSEVSDHPMSRPMSDPEQPSEQPPRRRWFRRR